MLKQLAILPFLATLITSSPTTKPVGNSLIKGLDANVNVTLSSRSISNAPVAAALEAALAGANPSVVDPSTRAALSDWLNGPGKGYCRDRYICDNLQKWCTGPANYYLPQKTRSALDVLLNLDVLVGGAGGSIPYLNGLIEKNQNGKVCQCSYMPQASRTLLGAFVDVNVSLDVEILAALRLCAAGGISELLTLQVRAQLLAWLKLDSCPLDIQLILLVRGWLEVGTGVTKPIQTRSLSEIDTRATASGPLPRYVLTTDLQVDLQVFIKTNPLFLNLDLNVQVALKLASLGGISSILDPTIQISLNAFLDSTSCPLPTRIHAALRLWIQAKAGTGLQLSTFVGSILNLPVLNLFGTPGCSSCLSPAMQQSVTKFTQENNANSTINNYLTQVTKTPSASSLNLNVIVELIAFLSSASCPLDPTVRAALLVWLSLGNVNKTSVALSANILNQVRVLLSVNVNLSPVLASALEVIVGGGKPAVLTVAARAELVAALIRVGVNVDLGLDVVAVVGILGWLSGCPV